MMAIDCMVNNELLKRNRAYSNYEVEEIIRVNGNMVFRLALIRTKQRDKAEDIFQEVFIRFLKLNERLESENHERAWLIKTTLNCCKDYWKSAWNRRVVYNHKEEEVGLEEQEDKHDFIREIVMELPDKYRTIVHLYYYEEFSIKEIGEMLSVNQNTISTRLMRAREILRRKLEKGGFDYEL